MSNPYELTRAYQNAVRAVQVQASDNEGPQKDLDARGVNRVAEEAGILAVAAAGWNAALDYAMSLGLIGTYADGYIRDHNPYANRDNSTPN